MKVYFDNAASSFLDPEVFEKMIPYFTELQGNPSSSHGHGRVLKAALEKSKRRIAELLNVEPGEIIITSGGTEADNMILLGAVKQFGIRNIITTEIEHHAVTHTLEGLAQEFDVKVHFLSLNERGEINFEELEELLKSLDNVLVSLMHANNELGIINDIKSIGELCEKYRAKLHSDTVQSMGTLPLDFSDIKVDFATASAHKFYGPKGVGFMYMSANSIIPPMILGGSQERNMRAGTENIPAIVGMAYALEKCVKNIDEKAEHLKSLKKYMIEQLELHLPNVQINGNPDAENSLPTVLNVAFPPVSEEISEPMILMQLDMFGVSVSGGSACSSGSMKGSHVLNTLGLDKTRVLNSVRFSFGTQNTKEEVDYVIDTLKKIYKLV